MAPPRSRKLSPAKLEELKRVAKEHVEESRFYEAEQAYSMLFARLSAQGDPADAAQVVALGSLELLKHGQAPAATKLAQKMFEAYKQVHLTEDRSIVELVRAIAVAFPETPSSFAHRLEFVKAALSWSRESGGQSKNGNPDFWILGAETFQFLGNYAQASRYYLRARTAPIPHAKIVLAWSKLGKSHEWDLFIVREVLRYLAEGDKPHAAAFWEHCRAFYTRATMEGSPACNFVDLLMEALEMEKSVAVELFRVLRSKYKQALDRDEQLDKIVGAVGTACLGLPKEGGGLQDAIGGFLGPSTTG